jgi:2-iminobutanoate/2-iminopropanoate deaminase
MLRCGYMTILPAPSAPTPVGPYSQAVRMGNLLFSSGQLPINPASGKIETPDVEGQARQVFSNIKALLGDNGLTLNNVVKSTLFLRDMGDFAAVNAIYEDRFNGHKPARSTIQAAKLPLGAWVLIEVIAEFPAAAA